MFANYFELITEPDLVLYRYNVQCIPGEKGKKLAQIVNLLLELPVCAGIRGHIVTDFKSTLICRKRLSITENEYQIQYRSEGEDTPRANATIYRVAVQETGILNVPELVAFLTSTSIDSAFVDKKSTIQALNILKGYFSRASPARATVGANKSFDIANTSTENVKDLGAGLNAIRGFVSSVRVAASRILVNINVTHASFYKVGPLITVMREFGIVHLQNLVKTEKFLKKLRVKVVHIAEKQNRAGQPIPRIKTIAGFANRDDGHGLAHPPRVKHFGAGVKDVEFFLNSTGPYTSAASGSAQNVGNGEQGKGKKKGKQVSQSGGGSSNPEGASQGQYISVYAYFTQHYPNHRIENFNAPVINVGTRENPSYLPVEVCLVEPGQSTSAKLSPDQTQKMIDFAVREPFVNAQTIVNNGPRTVGMLQQGNPLLANFGVSMDKDLITVYGRVLPPAKVNYKNTSANVKDGGWNMLNVKFNTAASLKKWTTLILSEPHKPHVFQNRNDVWKDTMAAFYKALRQIGIIIEPHEKGPEPITINSIDNLSQIDQILEKISAKGYELVFVILPTKNTPLYDYIKTQADIKFGLHTVCSVGSNLIKGQNQYFNNVALKFNLKLGGINQLVDNTRLGVINEGKTMVVGIDVTHPSPGSASNAPSVASMVASVDKWLGQWPAALRIQKGKEEMVDDLSNMLMSRLLLWKAKNKAFPTNIIVYRDGVSEGQYDLVLDLELPLLRAACADLYPAPDTKNGLPHMTIIICGKRHSTRFYPTQLKDADSHSNPRSGTVVDRGITDPTLWDFYLQAHTALKGTARSCHYIVILDEIFRTRPVPTNLGYKTVADVLEDMTYCMCHLFGRATKSVSLCPPAKYADLVCERARKYLAKHYDPSTPSGSVASGVGGKDARNEDIQVHPRLRDTMFYI